MSATHEPIRALEPDNLLAPLDLTDGQQSDSATAPDHPDRDAMLPRPLEGRMIPDHRAEKAIPRSMPRLTRARGGRGRLAAWIVGGAVAAFAAGAALPDLARKNLGPGHRTVADTKAAPAASEPAQKVSGSQGAPANADASAGRPSTGVPCDQQTWPNLDRECLKRPAAASTGADPINAGPSPLRTVNLNKNPDGSPRTTPGAPATAANAPAAAPPAPAAASLVTPAAAAPAATQPPAPAPTANAAPPNAQDARPGEQIRTPEQTAPSWRTDNSFISRERRARHSRRYERRHGLPPERLENTDQQSAQQDGLPTASTSARPVPRYEVRGNDAAPPAEPSRRAERPPGDDRRKSTKRRDRERERDGEVTGSIESSGRSAPRDRGFFSFLPFGHSW